MLTAINKDNKNNYLDLFQKAFKALKDAGKLTEEEIASGQITMPNGEMVEAFTSLEQYFTRIGDLYAIDKKYALLLPLDEPMFEINANTREIIIPAHFKKHGVSVEGDTIAETLIFKINRFVDFVDLSETDIFVQWEIEGKEEYSNITFKHLDYDPEYLLFAWPITNKVTEKAGVLKFSVRCIKREGENSPITYSFNTLPASVGISKALKSDLDYDTEAENADELFITAIENTMNTSSEEAAKVSEPKFEAPGLDLTPKAYLLNNSVVLKAQAITNDAGKLTYFWTYDAAEPELAEEWKLEDKEGKMVFEKITEVPSTERQDVEVFYVKANGEPDAYNIYTGEFSEEDMEKGIFERYAAFEITAENKDKYIAGKYNVTAVNRVGFGSKSVKSSTCEIPNPKVLNIVTDLVDYGAIADAENGYVLPISVETDKDVPTHTDGIKLTYNWMTTTTKPNENGEGDWAPVEEASNESNILTVKEPGWYKVEVISTLNRANIAKTSNIAKVTMPNAAPVLTHPEGATTSIVDAVPNNVVDIKINLNTPYESELQSEGVQYVWFTGDATMPTKVVDGNGISGQGTDTLSVLYSGFPAIYWCEVSNKLGGVYSTPARSGAFAIM